jgi:hypothetical protein
MKLRLFLLVLVVVALVKAQEKPRYVSLYLNDGEILRSGGREKNVQQFLGALSIDAEKVHCMNPDP